MFHHRITLPCNFCIFILYRMRFITGHTRKLRVVKKEALTEVVYFTPTMLKMYIAVSKKLRMKAFLSVSKL